MTKQPIITRWQQAATVAVEAAYRLPYILITVYSLILSTHPPRWVHDHMAVLQLALAALLYGIVMAPLRLWRASWYIRLASTPDELPSLCLPGCMWHALGWRWQLWWRRLAAVLISCLPSSILWAVGNTATAQSDGAAPLLWLLLGGMALLVGIVSAALWQCRYVLAPFYVLAGEAPDTAMALSVRAMRGNRCTYINFLGNEWPRLLLCLLLIPSLWILPSFHRRRTALLTSWIKA